MYGGQHSTEEVFAIHTHPPRFDFSHSQSLYWIFDSISPKNKKANPKLSRLLLKEDFTRISRNSTTCSKSKPLKYHHRLLHYVDGHTWVKIGSGFGKNLTSQSCQRFLVIIQWRSNNSSKNRWKEFRLKFLFFQRKSELLLKNRFPKMQWLDTKVKIKRWLL